MLPIRLICLSLMTCFILSCEQNFLFEEEKTIPEGMWAYRDTLNFAFTVTDTSALYNMYVDFEHADTFPNQNIYVKLHTLFPGGKRLGKTRSFDLFNMQGASNGQCSGGQCRVRSLLQDNAYFNTPGEYVITLEQFMRRDPVPGIRSVGLVIEKTGKKKTEAGGKKG